MNNFLNQIGGNVKSSFLRRRQKIFIISVLVFFVTVLHYLTADDYGLRHVFFRELYFLPIMLAAFWFGLRGGLATSLLISLVYGSFILMHATGPAIHNPGDLLEIVLFNIVGLLFGWMRDREISQLHKLRKAENLAAIGRAVSMIAHDLKTPLVAIGGLSRQLSEKLADDSPQGEKIKVIRQQADRLENMVMNMLDFAKPLTVSKKLCDVNQVVKQAYEAIRETAHRRNITIDIQKTEPTACNVDEGRIVQVLINLLANAVDASPDDGTVTVAWLNNEHVILIEVSDKGKGVDASIAEKIFEPFISTRSKGTGLGLAISRKIVEAHAGKLEYENNINGGATFRISIPVKH